MKKLVLIIAISLQGLGSAIAQKVDVDLLVKAYKSTTSEFKGYLSNYYGWEYDDLYSSHTWLRSNKGFIIGTAPTENKVKYVKFISQDRNDWISIHRQTQAYNMKKITMSSTSYVLFGANYSIAVQDVGNMGMSYTLINKMHQKEYWSYISSIL